MQNPFKREKTVRVSVTEIEGWREEVRTHVKARETLAIQISDLVNNAWAGNDYRSYEKAVAEIDNKYNAKAKWGVELTGSIIDLRGAFVISNGVRVKPAEGVKIKAAEKELQWCRDFFEYNKLDREFSQELAKEAEIEGKIALKITPDKVEGNFKDYKTMIAVRYISWTETKYKVTASPNDYMKYETLEWQGKANKKNEILKAEEFVYSKFGGRINKPNEAQPKILKCLTQIDDVSHALKDWREINRLFAAPIFDVLCDDQQAVDMAKIELDDMNKKIRKGFIHANSVLTIQGPDMAGVASLENEIIVKIKIISGTTGIPVHFLGLLDLLKNRATGDNTRELVIAGTSREREIWKGAYKEAIEKGMRAQNKADGNDKKSNDVKLDPTKVDVEILVYTQEQWDHLEKVLLPMYLADAITIDFLLSQTPGVDVGSELERRAKADKDELNILRAENQVVNEELREARQNLPNQSNLENNS